MSLCIAPKPARCYITFEFRHLRLEARPSGLVAASVRPLDRIIRLEHSRQTRACPLKKEEHITAARVTLAFQTIFVVQALRIGMATTR